MALPFSAWGGIALMGLTLDRGWWTFSIVAATSAVIVYALRRRKE